VNVELIYKDIIKICEIITSNDPLSLDLAQEVSIVMMSKENIDSPLDYAFKVAWFKWNSNNGVEQGKKNNGAFKYLYRDYTNGWSDIEDYKYICNEETEPTNTERLDSVLSKLDTLEYDVMKEYIRKGCNVSLFSLHSDIERRSLEARIKTIIEKCQTLK